MKTEQRSLRLSPYHIGVVAGLQKKHGYTFTDAMKYIIDEFSKSHSNENSINRFLQKLENNLKTNIPSDDRSLIDNQEILTDIKNNIQLILKVLIIIGSADSRTVIEIETLFGIGE